MGCLGCFGVWSHVLIPKTNAHCFGVSVFKAPNKMNVCHSLASFRSYNLNFIGQPFDFVTTPQSVCKIKNENDSWSICSSWTIEKFTRSIGVPPSTQRILDRLVLWLKFEIRFLISVSLPRLRRTGTVWMEHWGVKQSKFHEYFVVLQFRKLCELF